ncbi:DEAD/DEAH box helicase [Microvirga sp. HBU67558]|uniref:DEAD/DEAH box helicase n=1 Tax=Microvirga TaxID=186650 RepID=UPI001B37CE26|nr:MULTISPECIES: ATP-binding domain-containing protein [unclassified Microvirga]MBQ0824375.1 DEAD/DEAH box helicase [Microvirga sp. HBU67558]
MINTIWGSTNKPVSSRRLADALESDPDLDGTLYIGYPVIGTPDGAFPFDAVLLSPTHGVVIFDIVEGRDIGEFRSRQDNAFAKLQSKLLQYPSLVRRRQLVPIINVATFAPVVTGDEVDEEYPTFRGNDVAAFVSTLKWDEPIYFPALASAIQSLSTIRKGRRKKVINNESSRGAKLQRLSDSIANLDADQGAAVVETVNGVQRIRGLAGSGKTIVLALKVAYLHAQNPDWQIAVTFNTRALKGQFERLVTTFVIEQTNEEPDWRKISILHSWGSPAMPGVYYNYTKANELTYYDFGAAQAQFGADKEFDGACLEAIASTGDTSKEKYDVILVDEAQDLPASFLRLCYKFLRVPKRLIYAYDELQTLTNISVEAPENLFGEDINGRPLVSFEEAVPGRPRQDIILERCYRNSRPILATAHALGFGIYREPGGLIQIFDRKELWLDVGYAVKDGRLEDGQPVSLQRTPATSPPFLEDHSPIDDIIHFQSFENADKQDDWLVEQIIKNIQEEELSPEDIIVINPNPLTTRTAVAAARAKLFKAGINSSIAGVSGSPDIFFEDDVVTFTGIFRAKGNEAAMVYIINSHDCYNAFFPALLARTRNRLFTAITRSKAWVRVLGVGPKMDALTAEYSRIKENDFALNFVYPDEKRRKELRVINREMTKAERSQVSKKLSDLSGVLDALERGEVQPEDLPIEMRERLRSLFS